MADGMAVPHWEPSADHWKQVAADAETESAELQQAASAYVAAETSLGRGDLAKALSKAEESRKQFGSLKHWGGIAACAGLIVHAHCLREERKEAAQAVLAELKEVKAAPDGSQVREAYAKILLAQAEVNCEGRGQKKREEALAAVQEAREIFRGLKDKHQEGIALLMQASICTKRKGSGEERSQDVLKAAREAQRLFKDLGEKRGEGQTLHLVGLAFGLKESYQDAVQASGQARELFRSAGDVILEANECQVLAGWCLNEKDSAGAVAAAAEGVRLLKESGYRGELEAPATEALVQAHIAHGSPTEALRVSEQFLMRTQISLDRKMEMEALLLVVKSYLAGGGEGPGPEPQAAAPCPLEALDAAERALQQAQALKDEAAEAKIMALLAMLHARRQEFEQAVARAERPVERVSQQGLESEGASLQQLAGSLLAKGRLEEALQKAQEAIALFRQHRHPQGQASSLLLLAQVMFELGRVDEAVETTKAAQAISQDIEDKTGVGEALVQITEFRSANNEHARAIHAADRARAHVTRYGEKALEARMHLLSAQHKLFSLIRKTRDSDDRREGYEFRAGWEDIAKATGAAKESVKLCEELSDTRGIAQALCVLAQVHAFTQRLEYALSASEEAIARFVELADVRGEAAMLVFQSQVHMAMSNHKKSLSLARQGHFLFRQIEDQQGVTIAEGVLSSLRRHEFVVDERAGRITLPEDDETQVQSMQLPSQQLNAGQVSDTIQKVARKMVGADDDVILSQDNPLMDIGITSMNAVLFRNKLGSEFEGVDMPVTLVFDYPTIRDLTNMVVDRAH